MERRCQAKGGAVKPGMTHVVGVGWLPASDPRAIQAVAVADAEIERAMRLSKPGQPGHEAPRAGDAKPTTHLSPGAQEILEATRARREARQAKGR